MRVYAINVSAKVYSSSIKKEKEIEMNEMYCVGCGFLLNDPEYDYKSLCCGCIAFSNLTPAQAETWIPATCGDDVCFTDYQGQPNLDGETCSHLADFDAVMCNF